MWSILRLIILIFILFLLSVYADQEDKKKGIFDRLEQGHINSKTNEQTVKVTGLGKPISSSIFSRLGGKSEKDEQIDEPSISFAGILKSAPKKVRSFSYDMKQRYHLILLFSDC